MGERWSVGQLPVCASECRWWRSGRLGWLYLSGATCEEEGMEDIPFGEARREEEGAVYR